MDTRLFHLPRQGRGSREKGGEEEVVLMLVVLVVGGRKGLSSLGYFKFARFQLDWKRKRGREKKKVYFLGADRIKRWLGIGK